MITFIVLTIIPRSGSRHRQAKGLKVAQDQRFSLDSQELEQFHRDGFIGPFDLYGEAEMESNLRSLRPKLLSTKTAIYTRQQAVSGVTNLSNYDRPFNIHFPAQHITTPALVHPVTPITRPDFLCHP